MAFKRDGYGQVEPNHLSAPRNGHVYAQLPAAEDIDILENGMFVKYDYAAGEVNFDGEGPWFMVFNEEKLYDERYQMHKDYAMKRDEFTSCGMTPRVFGIERGDIWTTNTLAELEGENDAYEVGDVLAPGEDGVLAKNDDGFVKIVKVYTMPDMQTGFKVQCIKDNE